MRDNQHHEDATPESAYAAILEFIAQWEKGDCECCSPSVLDEAFEKFADDDFAVYGPKLRSVGIALAQAGEFMCQQADEIAALSRKEPSGG